MTRLLTLVALSLAPAFGETGAQRIHVIGKVVEQTFTGDLAAPQIGDQLITTIEQFDEHDEKVGTGTGVCTVVSVPEHPTAADTLVQCLNTGVFAQGQIIFGGLAQFPEVGVVGRFGILGGTGAFRKARGEATLVVMPTLFDATFDLE